MITEPLSEAGRTHINRLSNHKILTREDVEVLIKRYKDGGCMKSREILITSNMRLVIMEAGHFLGRGLSYEDLISEGVMGLMRGIEKYDPTKSKLTTYAMWWIKQGIRRALSNQTRTVRLPVHMVEKTMRITKIQGELGGRYGRMATVEEIAAEAGVSSEWVQKCINAARGTRSLHEKTGKDEDSEIIDILPDHDGVSPSAACQRRDDEHYLGEALAILSDREREMIEWRFGFRDGQERTLEEVGEKFNLTRERIRQVVGRAISRMAKFTQEKNTATTASTLMWRKPISTGVTQTVAPKTKSRSRSMPHREVATS